MRFLWIVVSLFLRYGLCFAEVHNPQSDSIAAKPLIIERRFSDGKLCSIRLESAGESPDATLIVEGTEIRIPKELLADLSGLNLPDGVQVADFAGDRFLLLAGGGNGAAWQAKITIRDGCAVERELTREGSQPEVTICEQPLEVHEGVIPSDELQHHQTIETPSGSGTP